MILYQVLHELQIRPVVILGACPQCRQPLTRDRLAAALAETKQRPTRGHWLIAGVGGLALVVPLRVIPEPQPAIQQQSTATRLDVHGLK